MDQPLQQIHLVINKREYKLIENALCCMVSNYQREHASTLENMDNAEEDYADLLANYKAREMEYIKLISEIDIKDS
jgi:hypothetical protein